MASRAIWKGQLRLSLASIGVELHSAQKSGEKISFRQIHELGGKPIYYEKSVAGIGPVESSEIVKGYEYEKIILCCLIRTSLSQSNWKAKNL